MKQEPEASWLSGALMAVELSGPQPLNLTTTELRKALSQRHPMALYHDYKAINQNHEGSTP